MKILKILKTENNIKNNFYKVFKKLIKTNENK